MSKTDELLTRGVANVIPGKEQLKKVLESGKKLNVFLGIDPTATKIHLGHAVPLRKLQAFAEMGHTVRFLIGDFTALIGDTSDKDTERPVLTPVEIEENFQTYKRQAEKIIDFSLPNVSVVHNSEWLNKLSFEEIVKLCQHFSVGDFVGRELIRKRLDQNKRVGLHEFLYPVMQGYDSYFMDTDIQIGGTDQTFNMQAGRTLQKDIRGKESSVLATEFLIGTDGRKMSKSWGNAIWLEDSPEDMYAKIMAIHDDVIVEYFTLATNVGMEKVREVETRLEKGENPRDLKKELAKELVTELHTEDAAENAQQYFEKTVVNHEMPAEIPVVSVGTSENLFELSDLLVKLGLAASKSEAKRLVEQGGVMIDEERQDNPSKEVAIEDSVIIKVGKRKFVKVTLQE
ncbi:MAG TPA: tyrosine--tRNA ligase [Candidatus Saccharimonadales bacterium]|nr:tyrosine--tRNA ligase [Candidatus Saccharimonadales bacterium]